MAFLLATCAAMKKGTQGKAKNLMLTFTVIVMLKVSGAGCSSSCVTPAVIEGHNTSIHCSFETDVSNIHIQIDHYMEGSDTKSEMALSCTWTNGDMNCKTGAGYTFDNVVKDYAVLTIPNATKEHAGRYVCQAVPNGNGGHVPCVLYVLKCEQCDKSSSQARECAESAATNHAVIGVLSVLVVVLLPVSLLLASPVCFNTEIRKLSTVFWKRLIPGRNGSIKDCETEQDLMERKPFLNSLKPNTERVHYHRSQSHPEPNTERVHYHRSQSHPEPNTERVHYHRSQSHPEPNTERVHYHRSQSHPEPNTERVHYHRSQSHPEPNTERVHYHRSQSHPEPNTERVHYHRSQSHPEPNTDRVHYHRFQSH